MHDAALPRGALEDLRDRLDEPLVVVRDHALDARDAAPAQAAQERLPRHRRLGVHHAEAHEPPRAVVAAGDGGHHALGLHVALVAAVQVGRVEPQVRERRPVEARRVERRHLLVELGGHARDARGAQARELQRVCGLLDLAGGEPPHVDLLHDRDHRPVDARVGPDQLVGEVRALAQLRYPQRYLADRGQQPALAVAVAPVALAADLVRLPVHDLVDHRLELQPGELDEVYRAVVPEREVLQSFLFL